MSAAFVYIAYAADDGSDVAIIADHLRERGWSICFGRLMEPSVDDSEFNTTRLEAAASIVVVWSSNAANSALVRSDLMEASRRNKLIVAALDDAAPPVAKVSVVRMQSPPAAPALEALDAHLGIPFGKAGRRRGKTVSYGPPPDQRLLWGGGGAAVGAGAVLGALLTMVATGGSAPSDQRLSVARDESQESTLAPGSEPDGFQLPPSDPDTGQIRGHLVDQAGPPEGESAHRVAQRLEEFAWSGVFDNADLPARLAAISTFRIDFPRGAHAKEAVELETRTRAQMEQIRTHLVLLGYMPATAKRDTETLRIAVKAFERAGGLSSSGRITEKLAQGLSIVVEKRASLR